MTDNISTGLGGKGILISGGLGGLGREISASFSRIGARVVINDVMDEESAVPLLGDALAYTKGDASLPGAADRILDQAVTALGGLPAVVCCHAGIVRSSPILEYSLDDIQSVMQANLISNFALASAIARRWVAAEEPGNLIFTGSWVADVPWPGIAAYSASKAALKSLARSFARELAPFDIRANVVAPGIVAAGMALQQWNTEPDYQARAKKAIPLGALQTPRSVADAVVFLASDLARYMTGATLVVDGGASLYPMDDEKEQL